MAPLAPQSDGTEYKSTIERKKTDAKSPGQKADAVALLGMVAPGAEFRGVTPFQSKNR